MSDRGPILTSYRPHVTTMLGLDRERARRVLIVGAQIALLLVVLSRLATSTWTVPIGVLIVALLLAALVVWIWLYLANSSVEFTDSHMLITDWRSSTKAIPRNDVSRLIRVGIRPFEGPASNAVVAVNATDHCLFTLGAAYDVPAIARSLRVPIDGSYSDVMSLREVNRKYPGASVPWLPTPEVVFLVSIVSAVVIGAIVFVIWTATR